MPKTIMAPSPTLLSLGIILLLASHFGNTLPPPTSQKDVEADNRVDSQTTGEKDTQQQQVLEETSEFLSIERPVNRRTSSISFIT